jgi:hypothetical protein
MASSAVAILSVVGILGTAGAAMAVNADVLDGASDSALGNASSVLVPSSAATQPGQTGSTDAPNNAPAPAGSSATRVVTVPAGSTVPASPASLQPVSSGTTPTDPEPTTDPVVDEPSDEQEVDGTTGGSGGGQGNYDDEDEGNGGHVDDDSYEGDDND